MESALHALGRSRSSETIAGAKRSARSANMGQPRSTSSPLWIENRMRLRAGESRASSTGTCCLVARISLVDHSRNSGYQDRPGIRPSNDGAHDDDTLRLRRAQRLGLSFQRFAEIHDSPCSDRDGRSRWSYTTARKCAAHPL